MMLYIQRGQLVVGALSAQAPTEHVLTCVLRQRNVLTVPGADQVLFWMAYPDDVRVVTCGFGRIAALRPSAY